MREYKFRVWDKRNKRMEEIDGANLYLADGKIYEVSAGSFGMECTFEKEDVTERYIPLEYTGLKDKSGEEIYEGDVLRITGRYFKKTIQENMAVEYDESRALFGVLDALHTVSLNNFDCEDDVEVIGNIYENADLLSSTHN
jgi:uncharacterized phage protein (TIGR01671 family)